MREGKEEGRKELLDPAAGKVASLKTLQGGVSGGGSEEGREGDSFFSAGILSVALHKPSFLPLRVWSYVQGWAKVRFVGSVKSR